METKSFRIEGTPDNQFNWKVTICSLGAFGSIYEHQYPVTRFVNIEQGLKASDLIIDHILPRPGFEVTNVLDINLR